MISTGCKGKPDKQEPPPGEASGAQPTQAKKMKGSPGKLTPTKDDKFAPDITLPKGTGKPPVKTTKGIDTDADKVKALTAMAFAGFAKTVVKDAGGVEVTHKTDSRPHIIVTAKIEPCKSKDDCPALDAAAWKDKPELKQYFSDKLKNLPDNVFEVTDATLNGAKLVRTYQVAYKLTTDERGNQEGGYSHAVVDYYNDGTNKITVVAEYHDQLPASRDNLLKLVTKEELEKSADAFLDIYTQNW